MGGKVSKKSAVLASLRAGETDLAAIAAKVGCSQKYVQRLARGINSASVSLLPVPLCQDIALVDELAVALCGGGDGSRFEDGVRSLGLALMFALRLLGQVSAVPTMGRAGELQELVALARAMEPKPAKPDPALVAGLNKVGDALGKMSVPKTPEMAMFEMFSPVFQQVVGRVMGACGLVVPQAGGSPAAVPEMSTEERKEIFG